MLSQSESSTITATNSSPNLKLGSDENSSTDDIATTVKDPPSEIPLSWPLDGKLTLEWIQDLSSTFEWSSKNIAPSNFPFVFPVSVCDSLVLLASKILHKEPNCVTIDGCGEESSVVVVGDLHGQLHDVIFLLWDAGFPSENRFFVFNGDYVDRGAWGLETYLLLLAWKLASAVFFGRRMRECSAEEICVGVGVGEYVKESKKKVGGYVLWFCVF